MSDGPDFEAYRRYTETTSFAPVTVIDGGKRGPQDDYVQVEYSRFVGLDEKTTRRLVDEFARVTGGRLTDQQDQVFSRREARDWFSGQVARAQAGIDMEASNGGGISNQASGTVFMDTRTASLAASARFSMGAGVAIATDPAKEKLYDEFMHEHESAHQFLHLSEAGADYTASVRLLQRYPGAQTRDFLQNIADLRMVAPFRGSDQASAADKMMSYGYGNATAIESAINTPVSDLSSITPEIMYGNARTYDSLNSSMGKVLNANGRMIRPEMLVWEKMLQANPNLVGDRYDQAQVATTAQRLAAANTFPQGSPQETILEQLQNSATRLDRMVISETSAGTAPAPMMSSAPSSPAPISM